MILKRSNNDKGFTLVEILVAMAAGMIVLAAAYALYVYFLRASTGQDRLLEIQQESRIAMEKVVKETRAAGCYYRNTPIITATSNTLEFEADTDPDPAAGPWMIQYALNTTNNELTRNSAAWTGTAYGSYGTPVDLAGNITGLTFTYYDDAGAVITTPVNSQANRDRIRRIDIAVTAQTTDPNPSTNRYDTINLDTSVYLRCMGVQQSTDTTPCNNPTSVASADPGICGRLNLTWISSTSTDAAGYKIYYRPTGASFYSGLIDVPGGSVQSYTLTGLTDGQTYDVAMTCYDTSGNENASVPTPISGTSGSTDTTPNDSTAPDLPTGTDATAGDSLVTLSWTASTAVDTGGYHIYRQDAVGGPYTQVAEVDSTNTTYQDITVANCPTDPYQYKVMSWDCAANEKTLSEQAAVYGDGSGPASDAPVSSVTSTDPFETVAPLDPTAFSAVAGADKIYLSHTTSADTDLKGVRILRRTDQYPVDENDTSAVGPNNIADYEPLTPMQTYSLIDSYAVVVDTTYYYRAFTYDNCNNFSIGATSVATAKPCGDGTPGPPPSKHYGPPSAPASLSTTVCSTANLSWPASTGSENGALFNPSSEDDVVGYYIYRSTTSGGPYTKLNTAPVTTTSYADSTTVPGNTYYYVATAVDCANKESTIASPEATVMPSNIDWDPAITAVTSGTASITGSQHNVVKIGLKNLGNSSVTINSATFIWKNANAKLKKVVLTPFGNSANTLWDSTAVASGFLIDFSSFEPDGSLRRLASGSTLNEFTLDFRDSTGTGFVDMRNDDIIVTINYTNDSAASACSSSTFTVPVTTGPTITSSSQNRPVSPTTSNLNVSSVVVPAGTQDTVYIWTLHDVTVQDAVTAEAGTTVSSATLYYNTTDKSTTTAPSTDYSASPSGWTSIAMCEVGTSDTFQTASSGTCTSSAIPALLGKRVWYYVKAVDSNSNYDIQPEPAVGIYTYDQESRFNVSMDVRRKDAGGQVVSMSVTLTDQDSLAVSGAKISVTITGTPVGTTETGTMTESVATPGTYTYTAVNLYHDQNVDVTVTATKSTFTDAGCGITGIAKTTAQALRTCN